MQQKEKNKEWKAILKIANKNGYPSGTIARLKQQAIKRLEEKDQNRTNNNTSKVIWATFTYHGGHIRGITNIFRNTRIRIAYRATNTTLGMLRNTKRNRDNASGIYKLTCNTCQGVYIGQTGKPRILGTKNTYVTLDLIIHSQRMLYTSLIIDMSMARRNI